MVNQNQTYRVVRMLTDQALAATSTTLVNVTPLVVSLDASKIYKYTLSIFAVATGTAPNIRLAAVGPTSPTAHTYGLQGTATKVTTDGNPVGATGLLTTPGMVVLEGFISNGTTAGNLQIQAAQNTSDAAITTVKAGSMIEIWEVSNTT